jgi:peroxiredoxin
MLEVGSAAPDLQLEDTHGRAFGLQDCRPGNVFVFFMRSTSCPICNAHVKDLARHRDELSDADVRVLIAFPQEREAAAEWTARHDPPFTVVTGRRETPHEKVGLTRKMFGAMQQSGGVLVGGDGTVRHAVGSTMPVGSYHWRGLAEALGELRAVPGR